MVKVTVVMPAPAAMLDGEKTAVAPEGKPLTAIVIAAGKVVAPLEGLTRMVYTAAEPGITVYEAPCMVNVKSTTASVSALLVDARKFRSPP
jgi:hypothetical protein